MVWFQINIGRDQKAEPRWLLPLLCRAGGVTKAEVGAIRVEQHETRFEILAEIADQFETHARANKKKEGHVARVRATPAAADVIDVADAGETSTVDAAKAPERFVSERRPDRVPPFGKAGADERRTTDRDSNREARSDGDRNDKPVRHGKKPKSAAGGWAPRGRAGKPSSGNGHGLGAGRSGARTKPTGERPSKHPKKKFAKHRQSVLAAGNG